MLKIPQIIIAHTVTGKCKRGEGKRYCTLYLEVKMVEEKGQGIVEKKNLWKKKKLEVFGKKNLGEKISRKMACRQIHLLGI